MPATAGRVKMPHDNRVMTSSSLATTSVWKNVIGYDPYANPDHEDASTNKSAEAVEKFMGLMEMTKLQAASTGEKVRATCHKCHGVGHLAHECKNSVKLPPRVGAAAVESEDEALVAEEDAPVMTISAPEVAREEPQRKADKHRSGKHHKHHKHHSRHHHRRHDSSGSESDHEHRRRRDRSHRHSRSESSSSEEDSRRDRRDRHEHRHKESSHKERRNHSHKEGERERERERGHESERGEGHDVSHHRDSDRRKHTSDNSHTGGTRA
jgi:hypothetical protein